MGLVLVRLFALAALVFPALLQPALLQAQPQPQENQLDGSQTLFTVLAAINAAGYDANIDSNANSPVRKQVRDAIAQKHLASVEALKKFYADHRKDDPEADFNQYISFALSLQGPPDFQFWMPPQEIPPDVRKLDGLTELIASFYKEADIEDLWKQSQPALDHVIAEYHKGVVQSLLRGQCLPAKPHQRLTWQQVSGLRGFAGSAQPDPDPQLQK